MHQKIHIINGHQSGNEAEALRQSLEYYGFDVTKTNVGRPHDLFSGFQQRCAKYVILCIHGHNGKIVMPELADEVYWAGEPHGDLSPKDLSSISKLEKFHLITSGCGLYHSDWVDFWRSKYIGSYTAPIQAVEGNSSLQFILRCFYEISTYDRSIVEAHEKAAGIDPQTSLFRITAFSS